MRALTKYIYALCIVLCFTSTSASAVPSIQQAYLDNGLKVLLIEAHNVPMVSMQLSLPAGSRFDAKHKAGSASLLADMLSDHTAQHNSKAWAQWLDSEALRFGTHVSRDTLSFSLTAVKESLPVGLDVLQEALLQPGWDKKRFHALQEDNIAAAIKNQEEPGIQASQAAAALLYADHAYGHRSGGTAKSLAKIHLQDLKALYQTQCKPTGSVLAVSGDITMPALLALLNPRLQTWQGKPKTAALSIEQTAVVKGQSQYVHMPTSQMMVQFVRLGVPRSSQDFFPLFVLNHILGGGGFGSVLMEEVREKRGLVYGVYSYFMPLAAAGPFVISLQTRASQAKQAEQVVRQVMQSLAKGQISMQQLRASKDNLIGSFAQRMDSNRERVGLLAMIGFYQMPLDYLQRWTQQVESVTLADVQWMAKKYLQTADWNLIQVGPKQE